MSHLRARGTTILVTEHDVDFVAEVADTVTVLDHGTVALQGTAREVFQRSHRAQLTARWLDLPRAGALADALDVPACTVADLVAALSRSQDGSS